VEALKGAHPVQRAMVDCHGSQCGFCTPGFVMSLYAHYRSGGPAERPALCDALAGNLCRCTGYAPILAAGEKMSGYPAAVETDPAFEELPQDGLASRRFSAPRTLDELLALLDESATLLGGGTDLALAVTKAHRDLDRLVYLGNVKELRTISDQPNDLEIGGAVTYAEAQAALARLHPDIGELVRRFGGAQVRACATLAGNIANASPIGDGMPVLLALDAMLVLQKGAGTRQARLARFYTGYRKTLLQPGEFIRAIRIPRLAPGARFAAYKVSKRFDQDISAVCAAFHMHGGKARFAFGGMAATPARARQAEAAYAKGVEAACTALASDFSPISDPRASAWYRIRAAQTLLRKFHAGASPRALLELSP
jgi:xanthine dehydrogenase small subunit